MLTPIKIIQDQQLGPCVSGRELYKLTTESDALRDTFTDRFRHNQKKLGLVVGQDFVETTVPLPGMPSSKRYFDALIRIEAAKKIASIQTKKRGAGVLSYLEAYELNPAIGGAATAPVAEPEKATIDDQPNVAPGIFGKPLESKGYQFEPSQPEAPKTRSQQLQDQLDQLAREVEQERQREEEQAQQANPVADEQPGTMPEMLAMVDARLEAIDGRINAMVHFFEQASKALRGLAPIGPEPTQPTAETAPVAEPTTRMLLVRLVNSYAAADRKTEHDTWKWLYGQFDLRKGFNVYAQAGGAARGKDESYLTVIEQQGLIEELYSLAKKLMKLPELR